MSGNHAPLPPSGAHRWGNCPASPALEALYPEITHTPEQLEGLAAHEIAATMLRDLQKYGQARKFQPGQMLTIKDHPEPIAVTDEMVDGATMFVDFVLEKLGDDPALTAKLHIEERVEIPGVHPDNYGTPDVWWASINPGIGAYIHLFDFKMGFKFVDDFENMQLGDYAWGIIGLPEFAGIGLDGLQFEFGICQPRNFHAAGPCRTWNASGHDVQRIASKLRTAAFEARSTPQQARALPGAWCEHCLGRRACTALQAAADGAMDIAGTPTPVELPPDALGIELRFMSRALMLLEARVEGLREQARGIITGGGSVPGWEVERGNSREQWTRPPEEIYALGALMNVDLRQNRPITPEQARKAGISKELVAGYSARPPGALKLQPSSNTLARKVFSQ